MGVPPTAIIIAAIEIFAVQICVHFDVLHVFIIMRERGPFDLSSSDKPNGHPPTPNIFLGQWVVESGALVLDVQWAGKSFIGICSTA